MKILLICGSLLANVALATAILVRPSLAPPAMRDFIIEHTGAAAAAPARAKSALPPPPQPKLWSLLDSESFPALAARLRAAGFPPDVVRGIVTALINSKYEAQIRALNRPDPSVPFWKQNVFFGFSDKRYTELDRLYRERSKAIRAAVGDDDSSGTDVSSSQRRRFGNLSTSKIQAIERIVDDYNDMNASIRSGMNGIELPEDREKFDLLMKEKRADLLTVMTPEELAEYEIRTSRITDMLRSRWGAFDPSEVEFKGIFQAYQAVSEKISAAGGFTGMDPQLREQSTEDLAARVKAALGETRFLELTRSFDNEYQLLSRIAQQQNLGADVADRTMALRTAAALESQRIAEDTSVSLQDRRNALKQLGQTTKTQITGIIGQNAADSYFRTAQWLNMLNSGAGVSLQPRLPLVVVSEGGGMTYMSSGLQMRPVPLKRSGP